MAQLGLALRALWRVLTDRQVADRVRQVMEGPVLPVAGAPTRVVPVAPARLAPVRSEALSLLAVLQRESRLVDFLKEDIAGYSDAQVGAAVRDVHRSAGAVIERVFALRAVMAQTEGSPVEVPAGADAGRVRLVGNVSGGGPYRGTLQHAGWEATKVELPDWSGSEPAARVVAPAEVELK